MVVVLVVRSTLRGSNAAAALVAAGAPVADAARELAGRFGLSERQARRYVERAAAGGPVEAPQATTVFTVKLPVLGAAATLQQPLGKLPRRNLRDQLDTADGMS